jgi:U3 small nucleolar RNA-associated protein 5
MHAIDVNCYSFAAVVNSKELGEMDTQENTTPTHHQKESAKKKERARKRTSSVLDSTNGETCLVKFSTYSKLKF